MFSFHLLAFCMSQLDFVGISGQKNESPKGICRVGQMNDFSLAII